MTKRKMEVTEGESCHQMADLIRPQTSPSFFLSSHSPASLYRSQLLSLNQNPLPKRGVTNQRQWLSME